MTFIKHFWYDGYKESAPWPLINDIKDYCKTNYCEPLSVSHLPDCLHSTILVVMKYKGPVAIKQDTENIIPNTNHYYYKCSKCGFNLVEHDMTICPGCGSHFVGELEVE